MCRSRSSEPPASPSGGGDDGWSDPSTPAFARLVPQDRRYSVRLFAQRFSTRFLRVADALARRGVAAVTELSAVSTPCSASSTLPRFATLCGSVPLQASGGRLMSGM